MAVGTVRHSMASVLQRLFYLSSTNVGFILVYFFIAAIKIVLLRDTILIFQTSKGNKNWFKKVQEIGIRPYFTTKYLHTVFKSAYPTGGVCLSKKYWK